MSDDLIPIPQDPAPEQEPAVAAPPIPVLPEPVDYLADRLPLDERDSVNNRALNTP